MPARAAGEGRFAKKNNRNLQGLLTFSACTVNTIIWFVPIFALALVKLVVPVKSVRTWITRLLMLCGEGWVGTNSLHFCVG